MCAAYQNRVNYECSISEWGHLCVQNIRVGSTVGYIYLSGVDHMGAENHCVFDDGFSIAEWDQLCVHYNRVGSSMGAVYQSVVSYGCSISEWGQIRI